MDPSSANQETADTANARLARIERLLASDPAQADKLAAELLAGSPGHPVALLYQAIARRLLRNPASAIDILTPLSQHHPDAPMVHLQLGIALRETGRNDAAVESLRRAVAVKADFADAWLALADLLTAMADRTAADEAFTEYARYAASEPRLREPIKALNEGRFADAESLLRSLLQAYPSDIVALCMLAEAAEELGRTGESEALLKRCLQLAPGFRRARHSYAVVLLRRNRAEEALAETERLLAEDPGNPDYRKQKAAIHMQLRNYNESIDIYRELLDEIPNQPGLWTSLGHSLKSVGRHNDCIEAYRRAISIAPRYGEAYWSIANMKVVQISDAELGAMQSYVTSPDLAVEDRIHFHFAIGKALEDRREYTESFHHYDAGNRLRREIIRFQAEEFSEYVRRCKMLFTTAFFSDRSGLGCEAADPIFIVGLPRSGSTLVEQILASHSSVEGTTELPDIGLIVNSLVNWNRDGAGITGYPEVLSRMPPEQFSELGEAYINQTRIQRKLGRAFFIDKMPNNFMHTGLIHLILPNARIIDVRRHPLAGGFSVYKQHFARRQDFSYSLADIGRYYRDYVELMAHFDRVLPGRVHRVIYESLVDNTENEVRRLLQYCRLPYEQSCLDYHKNDRAVSTPSSEQVRSPIFRDALDNWRHYEAWLGPLKSRVEDLIECYPDVPVTGDTDVTSDQADGTQ